MPDKTDEKKLSVREKIARRKERQAREKLVSSPSNADGGSTRKRGRELQRRKSRFGSADPVKNAKRNQHVKGTGGISPKEKNDTQIDDDEADEIGETDSDSDAEAIDVEKEKENLLAARGMLKTGYSEIDFNLQFHSRGGDHPDILTHPFQDNKMFNEHGIILHSNNSTENSAASEGLYVGKSSAQVSNAAKNRQAGRILRESIRHEDDIVKVKKVKNPPNDPDAPACDAQTGHIQCPPHGSMESDIFYKGRIKVADAVPQQALIRPLRMNDLELLSYRKEIPVIRRKPAFTTKHHDNKLSRLQVNVGIIGFDDHPLFSLEDQLAAKLRWIFAQYTREARKNSSSHMAKRLLKTVPAFTQEFKDVHGNDLHNHQYGEKLRRNAIDLLEEISQFGAQTESDLELNKQVYTCWEALKHQRKLQKFTSTTLRLQVRRISGNKLHSQVLKSIMKAKRVLQTLFPIMKQHKATSEEVVNRFQEVVDRISKASKAVASSAQHIFILDDSASKDPSETCPQHEQLRRKKIQNLRVFAKLYLNGKKVGKTKEVSFLPGFRAKIQECFNVDLYYKPSTIKLRVCQRNTSVPGPSKNFGSVHLAIPGDSSMDNMGVTTTAVGPSKDIYQFATYTAMEALAYPKTTSDIVSKLSVNADPNSSVKNDPQRLIQGFLGASVEWAQYFDKAGTILSADEDNITKVPPKSDEAVLQSSASATLIGTEISNNERGNENRKSVVVNGDELLDKDMLPVVEKMKNIDPNDPAAREAVRMLEVMKNVANVGDVFRLEANESSLGFHTAKKHLFKDSMRDCLLKLRKERPGLFHGCPPIPLSDQAIRKETKFMSILNSHFGKKEFAEEQDESFASEYLVNQIREHQLKVQTFFTRVRAAQSNLQRRKGSVAVNVNAVVKQGVLPTFDFQLAGLAKLFARRRKLRPQPIARQVQARPKAVYLNLNLGRAYNMPIRAGSNNLPRPSNDSPRRRGRSPSPGRRGRSNSPTRRNRDLDDMSDDDFENSDPYQRDKELNSLHCYAEISFQGQHVRTHTVSGASPHFGQNLKIKLNPDGIEGRSLTPRNMMTITDDIRISLFDKVEMHADKHQHNSRNAVLRSESRFLGSFTIPFTTVYMNKQISGLVPINKPIFSMGYDSQIEDETESRLRLMITTEPALQLPIEDETPPLFGEEAKLIRQAQAYISRLKKSSKTRNRNVKVLAKNIDQESILILRYLIPQKPPLSMDGGGAIKTIEEALRYVSLIPFIDDWQAFQGQTEVWCTSKEFLELRAGDWEEHAVLLMNYMMYIDQNSGNSQYEHFLVLGRAIPEGETVYVLRKEKNVGDPNAESPILLYDASTGKTHDASDPSIPLLSIGCLINTENVYANIQDFDAPSLILYDINDKRKWRPFFTEKQNPKPEITTCQEPDLEYSAIDEQKAENIEREIVRSVESELQVWRENEVGVRRGTVTTRFDRNVARSLQETLVDFEKAKRGVEEFSEDAYRGKLLEIPNTKNLLTNKSTHGFPINCTFTDTKSILSRVRDTNIHHNEAREVKFALSVKVFPYPNNVFSVWVFLMSICDKQNHL